MRDFSFWRRSLAPFRIELFAPAAAYSTGA
jgi:hypothetical protein